MHRFLLMNQQWPMLYPLFSVDTFDTLNKQWIRLRSLLMNQHEPMLYPLFFNTGISNVPADHENWKCYCVLRYKIRNLIKLKYINNSISNECYHIISSFSVVVSYRYAYADTYFLYPPAYQTSNKHIKQRCNDLML